MLLYFGLAILSLFAFMAILYSLWGRAHRDNCRHNQTLAVYRDQLNEVDKDQKREIIAIDEADAARIEIKRRILALAKRADDGLPINDAQAGNRLALFVAAIFVPILSLGIYYYIGSPTNMGLDLALQAEKRAELRQITALAEKMHSNLIADAAGGADDGWILLGKTYMGLGNFSAAAVAFAVVAVRVNTNYSNDADFYIVYAQALIGAAQGVVTQQAQALIDKALALDKKHSLAVYYKARALEAAGDLASAYALLQQQIVNIPPMSRFLPTLIKQAERIGTRLGIKPLALNDLQKAAIKAMDDDQRTAFIHSMVEGLAARLNDSPDDLAGWLRLARAYQVLGQSQKALNAYRKAAEQALHLPADHPQRLLIEKALQQN